uniref:GST C-terminal domain-containing protein n=1 Tax=Rhabditophanes sp. KR3021 TaxID=114890 RepID=A0AC35UBR3_9BILA
MALYILWLYSDSHANLINGDPYGQELYMLLRLLSDSKLLAFEVRTVEPNKISDENRKKFIDSIPGITLANNTVALSHPDDLLNHFYNTYRHSQIMEVDTLTRTTVEDFFRHFCYYIKNVANDEENLTYELHRINSLLKDRKKRYLVEDYPTHYDATVLSRLHSLRVAGLFFNGFQIKPYFSHLWDYLIQGYQLDAFTSTCPSDQNIILFWSRKDGIKPITLNTRLKMLTSKPLYSFELEPVVFELEQKFGL